MLNLWGFKHVRQPGPDHFAYHHEKFLRGLPQLAALMKSEGVKYTKTCMSILGEKKRIELCLTGWSSSCLTFLIRFTDKPNFYKMAMDHPLPCKMTMEQPPENISVPHSTVFRKEEAQQGVNVRPVDCMQLTVHEEAVNQGVEVDQEDDIQAIASKPAPNVAPTILA